MRRRFVHFSIVWTSFPNTALVDDMLNNIAPDWIRYSTSNWILYTDRTAQELSEFVGPYLAPERFGSNQYVFLSVDLSGGAQGWLPQFVWDWINQPRGSGWVEPKALTSHTPRPLGLGDLFTGLDPPKK